MTAYLNSDVGQQAASGYFLHDQVSYRNDDTDGKFSLEDVGYSYDHGKSEAEQLPHHIASHRAYPDLSLAGSAVQMVNGGKVVLIDGTSASAPLFAGMIANIVAKRRQSGLSSGHLAADPLAGASDGDEDDDITAANATHSYRLGWLNPTLYKNLNAFTDVTEGQNIDGRGIPCNHPDSFYQNLCAPVRASNPLLCSSNTRSSHLALTTDCSCLPRKQGGRKHVRSHDQA